MPERRDYLSVCNDQGVPVPDFQATFCVRCVQPECSRSRAGGLFETRVATWEERLFKSPPVMAKDDPLYGVLAAKRFVEVDKGRVPEVRGPSEWRDPRALSDDPGEPVAAPRPAPPPKPSMGSPAAPPQPERPPSAARVPLNTPFAQGMMLDGSAPSAPKADRWEVAVPAAPTAPELRSAPIVKAGARIKFTGG